MLDWHIQDPVDDFEIRNDIIYDIQGNDPFIDHPEYVSILWGNDGSLSNALRLRGVMDFDLSGSNGKSLHLYAQQDIPDLVFLELGLQIMEVEPMDKRKYSRQCLSQKEIIFF